MMRCHGALRIFLLFKNGIKENLSKTIGEKE